MEGLEEGGQPEPSTKTNQDQTLTMSSEQATILCPSSILQSHPLLQVDASCSSSYQDYDDRYY